ncbi:MAG: biopolymer transporter ExbD [Deltaproteobacteria bacterium]|jgi:biopolymer transport protein ExbD|nr:biopolymer transporter ExbD [Deltaproteobacteria bacterium]MBT4087652.1 biopolymer transporter ExbD [Deltaproteobacteria bacterium]MBT4264324.1 biopolymer transporter ExbD [Deltaproteobacteria bacterium]MBT4639836.1 biopolymer transporter ExbD [Deltaproteobacteria bacterium]MBT6503295.1 biopolymer transporter ExbD [Deltaproteobacteria bacterium]
MQFRKRKTPHLNIDITPLIDVIFLLLIFFMISTTFINATGIQIELPTTISKPKPQKQKSLEIAITAKQQIFFNGRPIKQKQLKKALIKAKQSYTQNGLIIRADGKVQHRLVVFVMDTAKQAGIHKFSIATRPGKK